VKLYGIMNSKVGMEEFIEKGFLQGDIFLDEQMELFSKYANKMSWKTALHAIFTISEVKKLKDEGIGGNLTVCNIKIPNHD
jgi:hypothetical protein